MEQQKEDTFDPLCPADDGYSEYRSKEQIQRSVMFSQKKKREDKCDGEGKGEEVGKEVDDDDDGGGGGDGKKNRNLNDIVCQWHYIDQSGYVQGPFSSEQMMGWNQAGFFPSNTLVKNGQDGRFVELGLVDLEKGTLKNESVKESEGEDNDIVKQDGVEDRIAMLKQSMLEDENDVYGVEDRIAALKNSNDVEERTSASGIEDRIAALKNQQSEQLQSTTYSMENREEPAAYPVEIPSSYDQEEPPAYPVDEPYYQNQEEPPAYPVMNDNQEEPLAYPVDETYYHNQEEPPTYPVDESYYHNQEEPPAYPVDETYYQNQEEPPAYPVEASYDYDDAIPYPTQVTYPIAQEEEEEEAQKQQLHTYPSMDYPNYPMPNPPSSSPPKSIYQGDKEVVGLIPSNVQIRRNIHRSNSGVGKTTLMHKKRPTMMRMKGQPTIRKKTTQSVSVMEQTNPVDVNHSNNSSNNTVMIREESTCPMVESEKKEEKNGVSDDYETFMEEINALGT
jgi:GYF domain.